MKNERNELDKQYGRLAPNSTRPLEKAESPQMSSSNAYEELKSTKYKPQVKKSLKHFLQAAKKRLDSGHFTECKQATEQAIKNKLYGEIPQDARLFLYCGIANLKLGYLIIAEQMFEKCLVHPELISDAKRWMALLYKEQGHFQRACEMYKQSLAGAQKPDHAISFELAQLYALQSQYDQALKYFTTCIELAKDDLLNLEPTRLAEYYMHRASVYEAIGLYDHSKMDLHRILEADPNFI